MKVFANMTADYWLRYHAWGGAAARVEKAINDRHAWNTLVDLVEEYFPDEVGPHYLGTINDFVWFDLEEILLENLDNPDMKHLLHVLQADGD